MDNNKGFNLPGCPGAVDEDRWPSEVYCSGFDYNGDASHPWYKDCCKWDGVKCVPKVNCSKLPLAMNPNKGFPPGCPGALTLEGFPSDVYCSGLDYNGDLSHPWWKECCSWSGMSCVPKANCSKLPLAINPYKGFPPGCPGALTLEGIPSEVYCSGKDYNGDASHPWWKDCCKWDGMKCISKGKTNEYSCMVYYVR